MDSVVQIKRALVRVAYAKSGNAHNATKTYRWDVYVNDRLVGSCRLLRDAKEFAREFVADAKPMVVR